MANKVKEYQKLPGSKKGFFIGKYTLWQGRDHLLHIFSRFGVEDYKRFYFNDIQAIITRKTIVGKVQNSIIGCLILLFLLPTLILSVGWSIFYVIVAAMLFIILLINLYLGPTCETRLMTAVQTEKLHSLNRLKKSFRAMDRLRPHIHQTQGILSREDIIKTPVRPADRNALKGPGQTNGSPEVNIKHEKGRAHMILFMLLLVDGVLVMSEFFITHVVPTILSSVAGLSIGIFVIIALVRQHNSYLPGSLRTLTWTSLGFVCLTFVMGYVIGIVFFMKNPSIAYNQWEVFSSLSKLSPWESPLKLSYNILVLCGALFLGIPGLIIQRRSESRGKRPAATRSETSGQPAVSRNIETG